MNTTTMQPSIVIRSWKIVYWVSTSIFSVAMFGAGIGNLVRADKIVQGILALGYPDYIMNILGIAKVLGVIALLVPGFPKLKEWAYAGFTIDLLGAFSSQLLHGAPLSVALPPFAFWLLSMISYYCYNQYMKHNR